MAFKQIPYATEQGICKRVSGNFFRGRGNLLEGRRGAAKTSRTSTPRGQKRKRLRIPNAAAQTRVVSLAGIRLGCWESARAFKGIICDDISEIAVGTLITERPPHRAERAPFGHSAPTSGILRRSAL